MGFILSSNSSWVHDMLAKEVILHGFDKLLTTSIRGFHIIRPINMVIEVTDPGIKAIPCQAVTAPAALVASPAADHIQVDSSDLCFFY